MSRSRRRTPIIGFAADSDKRYKTQEHRRARRMTRSVLTTTLDPDHRRLHSKQFGNDWASDKDGKHYVRDADRRVTGK